ncbi:hypothetical protein, partial [Porphyromonas gingivalis]|uniref:hypothetical protein n=1 Tax=Porphyromonas gingivalis TaxID=837 RepID=UPI0035294B27
AVSHGLDFPELLSEVETIVYSGTRINIDYFINEVMDEDHLEDNVGRQLERCTQFLSEVFHHGEQDRIHGPTGTSPSHLRSI